MASIYKRWNISASAESVWDRLRDFYALHQRLVPGFVVECRPEPGARVITFFNGLVARELLVGIDEQAQRVSYAVVGGKAAHHAASAQVFATGAGTCHIVWITDVLPDELADPIAQMMERGGAVMKTTLEAAK
jgi:hypothetical protein